MIQITATGTVLTDVQRCTMCVRSTGELVNVFTCFMLVKDAEINRLVRVFVKRQMEHPAMRRLAKGNRIIVSGRPVIFGKHIQIKADHITISKDSKKTIPAVTDGDEFMLEDIEMPLR